jgi:SulP family sulfate permease
LLSAAVADGMTNTRHNSNQELIGQGIANLVSPLFGGIAATGAIARTATNIRNGGTSPISAIVHSLVLLAFILLLAPLVSHVPLCALAGILFVVAYNIADFGYFFQLVRRAPRYDVIVLLLTFMLTVFTNIVIAVNIGVILALLFFVRRMYQSVNIEHQHPLTLQKELQLTPTQAEKLTDDVIVYAIQGPFFFGVAEKLEHALAYTHTDPKSIIFRFKEVPFMDITGIQTFTAIVKKFQHHQVQVYLCETNTKVKNKLINNDILPLVQSHQIYDSVQAVLEEM